MNIYIHVEVSARELDSKLLLATIAASRGHNVLVSEINAIIDGVQSGDLTSGVFHTKSLSPSDKKIVRHQKLIDRGMFITSQDEESGLTSHGYKRFDVVRYSKKTIDQSSAIFCWGKDDSEALSRVYSSYIAKIHKVGSPRADLWRKRLTGYWSVPNLMPSKPFLLISSNMGVANHIKPFHERIRFERIAGYYQRDLMLFARGFDIIAEDYRMTYAFIEAVRYLASVADGYEIVFRPHPAENIEAWNVYLEGIPNVHVIREGSISAWVNHAFAIMHNGCTTALEATISGKPVITYLPFDQEYSRDIPNELGERVESLEALSEAVSRLFSASQIRVSAEQEQKLPESVVKKVYLDDKELAAEKIVKVWETLDNGELSHQNNWSRLRRHLTIAKLRRLAASALKIAFPRKFGLAQENYKFPPMIATDIRERVSRLQQVLGLNEPLECKLLSERTVLIRKKP